MSIRKLLQISAGILFSGGIVLGLSAPAIAFQPILNPPPTGPFMGGALSPEIIYRTGILNGFSRPETYVWFDMQMLNYDGVYWTFQTTTFPSCGTSATPSSPQDCGVTSVQVDGVDVPGATAFLESDRKLTIVLGPTGYTTAGDASITATMSAGMWTISPVALSKAPIEWQQLVSTYETSPALPRPSTMSTVISVFQAQTVTFNSNGGAGEIPPATGQGSLTLPANTITRDGMRFVGWATSQANADEGIVAFADGATIVLSSDMTLFAVWSAQSGSALPSTGLSNVWLSVFLGGGIVILGGWMVLGRRLAKR
jgi:hypothetical protein